MTKMQDQWPTRPSIFLPKLPPSIHSITQFWGKRRRAKNHCSLSDLTRNETCIYWHRSLAIQPDSQCSSFGISVIILPSGIYCDVCWCKCTGVDTDAFMKEVLICSLTIHPRCLRMNQLTCQCLVICHFKSHLFSQFHHACILIVSASWHIFRRATWNVFILMSWFDNLPDICLLSWHVAASHSISSNNSFWPDLKMPDICFDNAHQVCIQHAPTLSPNIFSDIFWMHFHMQLYFDPPCYPACLPRNESIDIR